MSDAPAAADPRECLAGGGQMGALMRSMDWARAPLGAVATWPQSLRTSISICLGTSFPMMIAWGPALHMLYNDGYLPVLGTKKHPRALGQPLLECFAEIRDLLGPMFRGVMASGEAVGADDMMFPIERHGYPEETYFVFSYSPIRDESGRVGGVLTTCTETTQRVIGERRLRTLRALAEGAAQAGSAEDALARAAATLDPADTPFALLYLVEPGGDAARLVATSGIAADAPASPRTIALHADAGADAGAGAGAGAAWPLAASAATRKPALVDRLGERFGALPGGPWPEPASQALILPIARPGEAHPYGFLVAGISPRRALDEAYRSYLDLVADHVATAVANARAREEAHAAQLDTLLATVPVGLAFFDRELRYLRINDLLASWRGLAPARAPGKPVTEVHPPGPAASIAAGIRQVLATRAAVGPLEVSGVPPGGPSRSPGEEQHWLVTYFPVRGPEGAVSQVGEVVVDVTAQKRAELERTALLERERLARKEADLQREYLHALFMQAPTPICILRGPRYVLELVNARSCEVWGRRHEEVIGKPLFEALPELETQVFNELLRGVLATGVPYVGKEVPAVLDADGEQKTVYFNFVYAPLRDTSNQVDGVLVIAFDVSDEIRAREAMSRTVRYNEMFTGVLAHDLRNPLGAILMATQLILRRSTDEKVTGPASRILYSGDRMGRMIDQLLDFTRIRLGGGLSLERKRIDLEQITRRVVAEVEASQGRRFDIEVQGDATGEWDPDRLAQLISNLASNAAQHGDAGGSLRVALDARAAGEVVLSFRNEGTIPQALLPVLFDPFRGVQHGAQDERRGAKGLGLGLFISSEIVAAHRGALRVASTAEIGTWFTASLPRGGDGARAGAEVAWSARGPGDDASQGSGLFARSGDPDR